MVYAHDSTTSTKSASFLDHAKLQQMKVEKLEFRKAGISYKAEISVPGTCITLYWLPKQEQMHYVVTVAGNNTKEIYNAATILNRLVKIVKENKHEFTKDKQVVIIDVQIETRSEKANNRLFETAIRKLKNLTEVIRRKV